MIINLFKERDWLTIPFNEKEYNESIAWAETTLKMIENEESWRPNPDFYYCNYLCGQRNHACEYKPQPIIKESTEEKVYNPETGSYV